MLNWLAGHRQLDGGFDPDTTAAVEGPETPAPVFAVRAFKQAIFGTPQTQQAKPRRHSATDNQRPQAFDTKPSRPQMTRPKSWHDAQVFDKDKDSIPPEPLPSPTKGILVTPGAANARRKTVSFGEHVKDNDAKRQTKTGLPDDCPGKFPSPWSKPVPDQQNETAQANIEKLQGRNKLTEALEQARDDSGKRRNKPIRPTKPNDDPASAADVREIQPDSSKYWKQEYDIYRENTMREVKKLVAKQKAAKNFARDKDLECSELKEQLRLEQKKALLLEKRTKDLELQMKEFQDKLEKSQAEEQMAKQELRLHLQKATAEGIQPTFAEQINAAKGERKDRRTMLRPRSAILQPTSAMQPALRPTEGSTYAPIDGTAPSHIAPTKTKTRIEHMPDESHPQHNNRDGSPNRKIAVAEARPPSRGKQVATKPSLQPPRHMDIDPAQQDTRSIAISMGLQPPSPIREKRQDSPMDSTQAPRSEASDSPIKASDQTLEPPRYNQSDLSVRDPLCASTLDAEYERPTSVRPISPAIARKAVSAAALRPYDAKENVSPVLRTDYLPGEESSLKPSAAWNGLNAGRISRTTGITNKRMVSKDGQEVGADRIAAARARIQARGRQIS